jgi:peptidoglycan/LPS O-acetylase OafA/YrhL
MSRRVNPSAGRRSRRLNTILWVAGLAAITIILIRSEQTEILYILATLGVTALLVIVAMADLKGTDGLATSPAPGDDAAAINDRARAQGAGRK